MGVLRHASTAPRSIPNTNTNRIPITNPKPKTIPDPMPKKKTPSYPQNKVMWKSKHPLLNYSTMVSWVFMSLSKEDCNIVNVCFAPKTLYEECSLMTCIRAHTRTLHILTHTHTHRTTHKHTHAHTRAV